MVFIKVPCYFNLQKNSLISKVSEFCDLGILGLRGPVVEERLIIAMLTFLAAFVGGGGSIPWADLTMSSEWLHTECTLHLLASDSSQRLYPKIWNPRYQNEG